MEEEGEMREAARGRVQMKQREEALRAREEVGWEGLVSIAILSSGGRSGEGD
jgi:hypothetical protein